MEILQRVHAPLLYSCVCMLWIWTHTIKVVPVCLYKCLCYCICGKTIHSSCVPQLAVKLLSLLSATIVLGVIWLLKEVTVCSHMRRAGYIHRECGGSHMGRAGYIHRERGGSHMGRAG